MSIGRVSSGGAFEPSDVDAGKASGLDQAARDGRITKTEIKRAEQKLARTYGAEEARHILIRAVGQDPAKLDFNAVDYLQGRIGAMDGHVARFQEVLAGHVAGAKLLDANFDGKLDAKDLVFSKGADGKVDVKAIGQALCDKVRIGAAMVDAAHAMGEAQHEFGDLRANPQFFKTAGGTMGTMTLKPGARASEAILDIFAQPDKYRFECATALVVLRYKAILDLVGPRDFDRICKDLKIGAWEQENHAANAWKVRGEGDDGKVAAKDEVVKADLKPGDYTYFKNWSVSLKGYNAGWQGENVIFLGNGMYYGHPFGVTSGEEIVASLNEWRRTGSSARSASLLDLRASVDPSILKHDREPG